MAGSRTTKKRPSPQQLKQRAERQAAAEVMTNVMVSLLDHWNREELDRISSSGKIVCMRKGADSYRIGYYDMAKNSNDRWIVDHYGGHDHHLFFNKQAAVVYCLFNSLNKYNSARELLIDDQQLGFLQQELDMFYEQLKLAVQRKDEWKQDLYLARLSVTRPQLEAVRTNLRKKISSAKYTKVWENKT